MFIDTQVNQLIMNRGDTFKFPLVINEGTKLNFKQYQMRYMDKIYVGIMEPNQSFENALIRKVLTVASKFTPEGHPIICLNPKDTENLLTGKYFIEVKLVQIESNENIVTTILPLMEFFINGTNKDAGADDTTYEITKGITTATSSAAWSALDTSSRAVKSNPEEYEWLSI